MEILESLTELESRFAGREPEIHAFVPEEGRFERLRREAASLAARFPDPRSRPPLYGLPVGIKDVIHVDGLPTHAGSQLPVEALRGREADCVTRLRRAGALIVGKTVTTEFAYFATGPTRNPRSPAGRTHTPGGSSSGSAAAIAAGLVPLALGTQTVGSTIRPAAFCGIAAFKPSYDRIPRDGVIPLAPSYDHVGLFGTDAALLARAMASLVDDWRQPSTARQMPVLGIPEGPYLRLAGEEALAQFRRACERLQKAGFEIKAIPAFDDFDAIRDRHNLLLAWEAAQVHRDWLARHRALYHPKTLELIDRGMGVDPVDARRAAAEREPLRTRLVASMDRHGIDLWISPASTGPAPEGLESTGDPVMNLPWTQAGLPTATIPAGSASNGLPLGLQLSGRWLADENVLAWSRTLEAQLAP